MWDTVKNHPIKAGDILYFWLAGSNKFIGRTRAIADIRELSSEEPTPWLPQDQRPYKHRIELSWGQTLDAEALNKHVELAGLMHNIRFAPISIDPQVADFLDPSTAPTWLTLT